MATYADQSLLPGAPHPQGERQPKGEHAIELATSRLAYVAVEVDKVSDPDVCPENLLPWLAWGLSVDYWDPAASVEEKRALIKNNKSLHKKKGTVGAVKSVLADAGYPNATIREGIGQIRRDGTYKRNAQIRHRSDGHWAYYTIVLAAGDPQISAATLDLIQRVAPERCKLFEIVYE